MNTEIVKELVRQWRGKAEPQPCVAVDREVDDAADMIHRSMLEKKVDEAVQETLKYCAQDLEDVIRIYDDFSGNGATTLRERIRREIKPYARTKK